MRDAWPAEIDIRRLSCPPGLGLDPWWSWAITEYQGDADTAREHLTVWAPILRGLPHWIPLEAQLAMLHGSVPFQAVLREHLHELPPQQLAIDMPWFDLGLLRIADLVVSDTARRWAAGGRKALAATALPPLRQHAAQWAELLARHAPALQRMATAASSGPPTTPVGLTVPLHRALVTQGWQGDGDAFEAWHTAHAGSSSGWQTPEQLAVRLWNERQPELPWLPRRKTWPRRQTVLAWWRGERWVDVVYDPPVEVEARDGGPAAVALRGLAPRHAITLSKARARPYRGEPWLDGHHWPEVREAALNLWWLRPVRALGEAEAPWQPGPSAPRQSGGQHARAVHLRIASSTQVLPCLRKSALRARRAQRAAKTLVLWAVLLGLSAPLWISLLALLTALFKGVKG